MLSRISVNAKNSWAAPPDLKAHDLERLTDVVHAVRTRITLATGHLGHKSHLPYLSYLYHHFTYLRIWGRIELSKVGRS